MTYNALEVQCTHVMYLNLVCRYSLQSLHPSQNFGSQILSSAIDSAHAQNRWQLLVTREISFKKKQTKQKNANNKNTQNLKLNSLYSPKFITPRKIYLSFRPLLD